MISYWPALKHLTAGLPHLTWDQGINRSLPAAQGGSIDKLVKNAYRALSALVLQDRDTDYAPFLAAPRDAYISAIPEQFLLRSSPN